MNEKIVTHNDLHWVKLITKFCSKYPHNILFILCTCNLLLTQCVFIYMSVDGFTNHWGSDMVLYACDDYTRNDGLHPWITLVCKIWGYLCSGRRYSYAESGSFCQGLLQLVSLHKYSLALVINLIFIEECLLLFFLLHFSMTFRCTIFL